MAAHTSAGKTVVAEYAFALAVSLEGLWYSGTGTSAKLGHLSSVWTASFCCHLFGILMQSYHGWLLEHADYFHDAYQEGPMPLQTRHCTRAVYTSPIKTISNQKFRDFGGTFEVKHTSAHPAPLSPRPTSPLTHILRKVKGLGSDLVVCRVSFCKQVGCLHKTRQHQ